MKSVSTIDAHHVAHADLADPDVGSLIKGLAKLPATRGIRQQLHWHENSQYRLRRAPMS